MAKRTQANADRGNPRAQWTCADVLSACKASLGCVSIRTGASPVFWKEGARLCERYQGQSLNRLEDLRFLTGRGRYVADDHVANVLHAHVVRSPYAFARISRLNLKAARAVPGVVTVLSEADLAADGIGDLPCVTVIDAIEALRRRVLRCRHHGQHDVSFAVGAFTPGPAKQNPFVVTQDLWAMSPAFAHKR